MTEEKEKKCPQCGFVLLESDFYKNRSTEDGLSRMCKKCTALYRRERRTKGRGRVRVIDFVGDRNVSEVLDILFKRCINVFWDKLQNATLRDTIMIYREILATNTKSQGRLLSQVLRQEMKTEVKETKPDKDNGEILQKIQERAERIRAGGSGIRLLDQRTGTGD